MDRVGRMPGTGNAPQPAAKGSASIEPDDRCSEHLAMPRHCAIVGAPFFHGSGDDFLGVEIVAGRPNGVMIGSRTIIAEERLQSVACDDVAKLMIERPSLIHGGMAGVQFQEIRKSRRCRGRPTVAVRRQDDSSGSRGIVPLPPRVILTRAGSQRGAGRGR
jgi:hypothetical protein